jgi:enamine deaminase RidA (YjgF/YER057c/UK114 family)
MVGVMIERQHDGSAFESVAAYCRAVRSGQAVAVSGTTASGADGAALHPGDGYRQTRIALERALAAVERFGGSPEHVIRTRLFLTPEADWRECVRAHQELFEGVDPANTTLFVAGLIPEGSVVEVEVDAWLPGEGKPSA